MVREGTPFLCETAVKVRGLRQPLRGSPATSADSGKERLERGQDMLTDKQLAPADGQHVEYVVPVDPAEATICEACE